MSFATGWPAAFVIAIFTGSPVDSLTQKVRSAPSGGFSPRKAALPAESSQPGSR